MDSEEEDVDFYDAEENVPGDGLESATPSSQQQQNKQSAGGQRSHQQPRGSADPSRKPSGKRRPAVGTGKDGQRETPATKDHPPISPEETPPTPSTPAADQRELARREQDQQQPPNHDVLSPPNIESAGGRKPEVDQETSSACLQKLQGSRTTEAKDAKTSTTRPPAPQSAEVSKSTGNAVPAETKDATPIEVRKHRQVEQRTQIGNAENVSEDRIGASLSIAQASNLGSGMSVCDDGTSMMMLKNLDTNQMVPLSEVEEELRSHGIDPLSLHMLKRTKSTGTGMLLPMQDSTQAHDSDDSDSDIDEASHKGRPRLLKFLKRSLKEKKGGRKGDSDHAGSKRESDSGAGSHISGGAESDDNFADLETPSELLGRALGYSYIKVKVRHKRNKQFGRLFLCQELVPPEDPSGADITAPAATPAATPASTSTSQPQLQSNQRRQSTTVSLAGAIWTMKFSKDGKYLATGGQDTVVRVWCLVCEGEPDSGVPPAAATPTEPETPRTVSSTSPSSRLRTVSSSTASSGNYWKAGDQVFRPIPLREYRGHTADVLDLSWSKNNFLLSSSMDKTVRLWHVTRQECLCCFQHPDFVTAITFHPRDDRFFLSGSLDCKLRLWNIPDKKVTCWNESPENLITAVGFTLDGKIAVAGSYIGLCMFYETENMKYNTQIHVKASSRGAKGRKITGIEPMPGTPPGEEKLLITSNDSRIRLYNMRDKSLECKFKGLENTSSQIRASFSDDGRYIICGSEDRHVYVWDSDPPGAPAQQVSNPGASDANVFQSYLGQGGIFSKGKATRAVESFEAHSQIVTVAVFAPTRTKQRLAAHGDRLFGMTAALTHGDADPGSLTYPDGNIVISADHTGCIRVFRNDPVPRFGAGSESDNMSVRSTASSIKKIIFHPRQGLRFLRPGTNRVPSVTTSTPASPLGWAQNASNPSLNDPGRSGSLTSSSGVPKAASLSSLESFSASLRRSSHFSVPGSTSGRQKSSLCPSCGSADVRGFSVLDERGLPGQMVVCVACNKVVSGI